MPPEFDVHAVGRLSSGADAMGRPIGIYASTATRRQMAWRRRRRRLVMMRPGLLACCGSVVALGALLTEKFAA